MELWLTNKCYSLEARRSSIRPKDEILNKEHISNSANRSARMGGFIPIVGLFVHPKPESLHGRPTNILRRHHRSGLSSRTTFSKTYRFKRWIRSPSLHRPSVRHFSQRLDWTFCAFLIVAVRITALVTCQQKKRGNKLNTHTTPVSIPGREVQSIGMDTDHS